MGKGRKEISSKSMQKMEKGLCTMKTSEISQKLCLGTISQKSRTLILKNIPPQIIALVL